MTTSFGSRASSSLDDITSSLFHQLRDKNRVYDFDILQCPKCPERLEALELDVFQEKGQTYQRIWWTCRGLKNKTCHFPLWVPREVFWTRRTEEQMKTGYIPLPNIHLLPQHLWYLYPNLFRNKQRDIIYTKKGNSGTITPSSGHATRGSSVRPESVLTESEEGSRDSLVSTPLPSAGSNAYVPSETEVWDSEVPMRQIRIDEEDMDDNLELIADVHVPTRSWKSDASDQRDSGWKNSEKDDAKSERAYLNPEYVTTTRLHSDFYTDPFGPFDSGTDSHVQQRQHSERVDLHEIGANDDVVVLETLHPESTAHIAQDVREAEFVSKSTSQPEIPMDRKRKTAFQEIPVSTRSRAKHLTSDWIALVVPSENARLPESGNIAEIRERFRKQNQQQEQNANNDDDVQVVGSVMKELVVRVALEHDLMKSKTSLSSSSSSSAPDQNRRSFKVISLEEAKRDFADLTLEELLKGVNNLRSVVNDSSRKRPNEMESNIRKRFRMQLKDPRNIELFDSAADSEEPFANIYTEMANRMQMRSKRKPSSKVERPTLPRNLPADEKCIAAVELALKQSINGTKGPEEMGPALRISIQEGSPSEFRPEMISGEMFDPQNWRRPVHLGGHTNLDAFVTGYNLRYNRAEYLDALASELCKRKIMKFVPSIPVKQQRLVRRMLQRQSGQEDSLDLETLKKAVDPNALRLQIAHRLGIKNLDSMIPRSRGESSHEDDVNAVEMQHIGSAPLIAMPETSEAVTMDYAKYEENADKPAVSNISGSLHSFPVSQCDEDNDTIRAEKERELYSPYIPSFDDPEVDALVYRKFKTYAHDENVSETSSMHDQQQHYTVMQKLSLPRHMEATTSRIEYADFEGAFEEYEDDSMQHFDPIIDSHFDHQSL